MKTQNTAEAAANLRQKAEDLLKKKFIKATSILSEAETLKVIHELQVHQIELELMNEELILAKEQAEIASEKYRELYDFSPTGYFMLSSNGEILESNLYGAQLLEIDRSALKTHRFGTFVSDGSKPGFAEFLQRVFETKHKQTCEIILTTKSNKPVFAQLTGILTT